MARASVYLFENYRIEWWLSWPSCGVTFNVSCKYLVRVEKVVQGLYEVKGLPVINAMAAKSGSFQRHGVYTIQDVAWLARTLVENCMTALMVHGIVCSVKCVSLISAWNIDIMKIYIPTSDFILALLIYCETMVPCVNIDLTHHWFKLLFCDLSWLIANICTESLVSYQ